MFFFIWTVFYESDIVRRIALKWFTKDGQPEDYQGPRQLNDLAELCVRLLYYLLLYGPNFPISVTKKSGVKSKIKAPPPPATTQLSYLNLEETISVCLFFPMTLFGSLL